MRSPRSARPPYALASALLVTLAVQACTTENVTGIVIDQVAVVPSSATVLRDESVQLVAQVRDADGKLIDAAHVTWSSDRPSVVAVSPDGLARAVGLGPATVRASVGDAEGAATILVLSPVMLRALPQAVTLRAALGAGPPPPTAIGIRDEGELVVGLQASVAYASGTSGDWLIARLRDDDTPTTLDVGAETAGLQAGTYSASVLVSGTETRDAPLIVPVTMTMAGLAVHQTDGRTLVSGSNGGDDVQVQILLQPQSDVVLNVRSDDTRIAVVSPASLRIGPGTWTATQTILVTPGPGGGTWWGYETTRIRITVDVGASDPAYAPVLESVVDVLVFRTPFE